MKAISLASSLLLIPALSLGAGAQEGGVTRKPAPQAEKPQAEKPQQADKRMAPAFAPMSMGDKAILENDKGERVGTVSDYVIEQAGGRVLFCVLDVKADPAAQGNAGGVGAAQAKRVLVPYASLQWGPERPSLIMPLADVQKLPAFDREKIQELGAGASARAEPKPPEPKGAPGEAAASPEKERNVLASKLIGSPILAEKDPIGSVENLVLEPKTGLVAFAVVSRKEGEKDSQVLPYRALSRDTEGKFTIAMPAEELKKAPRVTGIAALEKPETVKAIHDFFKEVIQKRPTATGHAPKGQG